MAHYIIKRLLFIPLLLLLISFVTFCLVNLAPSDPAEVILRVSNIQVTPQALVLTRQEFGLDQPFFTRYWIWLQGVLQLDFGSSFITREPVLQILLQALWPTLYLVACVVILTIAVSVPSGIFLAMHAHTPVDKAGRFFMFSFTGMPDYWVGLLLIWAVSVKLNWLPINGMSSPSSIILPAVTLSLAYIGLYVKLIRNSILQELSQYYVMYARARGLKESMVIAKHVMVNAMQSALVVFGMSIPRLIAGTVIIENVFAWPGMGRMCVTAITEHDYPVIQAYVLLISLLYLLFNFLTDMLQIRIDPRLRYQKGAAHG